MSRVTSSTKDKTLTMRVLVSTRPSQLPNQHSDDAGCVVPSRRLLAVYRFTNFTDNDTPQNLRLYHKASQGCQVEPQ